MSLANKNPSWLPMFLLLDRIYHVTVRGVRQTHGNALIAIFMNMFQSIMFVLAFYMMAFLCPILAAVSAGISWCISCLECFYT